MDLNSCNCSVPTEISNRKTKSCETFMVFILIRDDRVSVEKHKTSEKRYNFSVIYLPVQQFNLAEIISFETILPVVGQLENGGSVKLSNRYIQVVCSGFDIS